MAVTLLVLVAAALRPGYLPAPFVIALLPFCAILTAGVLDAALGLALRGRRVLRIAKFGLLAAGAVALFVPWLTRLRHYGGLHRVQPRLERMLGEFRFTVVADTIANL